MALPDYISDAEMANLEIKMGGIPPLPDFISDEQMAAFEKPVQPTFMGDLPAIGEKALRGAADLGSFIEGINPLQPGGPRYAQKLADYITGNNTAAPSIGEQGIEQARQAGLVGDKPREAQTTAGKIAGEIAYQVPSIAVPGGTLGGRVVSAVGSGVGSGTAKALGLSPTVQALAGLGGSFAPQAAAGASKLLSNAGDDFERMALQIQRTDLKRADRFAKVAPGEDPKLIQALDGARSRGLMKGDRSAEALAARNQDMIDALGDKVSQNLKVADAGQTNVIFPGTTHADNFIASNPFEKDQLTKQLTNRLDTLNKEWDGTVSGLNKLKQKLYKIGYNGSTDSRDLDKAIARDLKEAVERQAELFGGTNVADEVIKLNAQQGENLTLRDVLQKGVYNNEMAGGAAKALRRGVISPVGGSSLLLGGGALSGNPAMVAGGILGAAASSRKGQFLLSDAARMGSRVAGAAGGSGGIIPALNATKTGRLVQNELSGETEKYPTQSPSPEIDKTEVSPTAQALSKLSAPEKTSIRAQQSPTSSIAKVLSNLGVQDAEASINTNVPKNMSKSTSELEPLLKAVKSVESAGNRLAVSNKGAKGAYQLMDATGREYHRRLGLKEKYDPFNESQAKVLAEAFLSDLKARYADDRIAIAAYNLGETRMNNAIKMRGLTAKTARWEDIYQLLPNETREYAPKVVSRIA